MGKECLHRFCAECIITALRSGNKECPTCRKKLVSKRSLRPDPNFDQLVEKIFPNRDEYEAHQESILESLSKSHSQNFITSITHGIKAQMAHAKAVNRKKSKKSTLRTLFRGFAPGLSKSYRRPCLLLIFI